MTTPDPSDRNVRPPFWRHRHYYLALKVAVLLAALAIAVRLLGFV